MHMQLEQRAIYAPQFELRHSKLYICTCKRLQAAIGSSEIDVILYTEPHCILESARVSMIGLIKNDEARACQ